MMAALKCSSAGWNGSLMHIWQTAPNNGWSDWDGLGVPHPEFRSPDGRFVYGMLATAPSVNRNADGRLEVFACTRDMPSGTFGKQRPITAGLIGSHLAVEWWAHRSP